MRMLDLPFEVHDRSWKHLADIFAPTDRNAVNWCWTNQLCLNYLCVYIYNVRHVSNLPFQKSSYLLAFPPGCLPRNANETRLINGNLSHELITKISHLLIITPFVQRQSLQLRPIPAIVFCLLRIDEKDNWIKNKYSFKRNSVWTPKYATK